MLIVFLIITTFSFLAKVVETALVVLFIFSYKKKYYLFLYAGNVYLRWVFNFYAGFSFCFTSMIMAYEILSNINMPVLPFDPALAFSL